MNKTSNFISKYNKDDKRKIKTEYFKRVDKDGIFISIICFFLNLPCPSLFIFNKNLNF